MQHAEDNGPPLFTFAAMAAFIAFFGAQYKQFDLSRFCAYPWRVADGEFWRLATCTFLHGSVFHIVFNTTLFFRFSAVVDNWLGPWAAMFLYAGISTSAAAAQLLAGSPVGVIGASGVVYGLFGFLWVMSRRRDDAAEAANLYLAETLMLWLAICAVLNFFGGHIGNTSHIWGLGLGWLAGQAVVARKKWRIPIAIGTVILWALPIVLCYRPIWTQTLGRIPVLRSTYPHTISGERREAIENPVDGAPRPGLF